MPFIRKVRFLCKTHLIFPRINGPIGFFNRPIDHGVRSNSGTQVGDQNKDFSTVLQMGLAIFGASQVHMMVNRLVIVVLVWSGEGR